MVLWMRFSSIHNTSCNAIVLQCHPFQLFINFQYIDVGVPSCLLRTCRVPQFVSQFIVLSSFTKILSGAHKCVTSCSFFFIILAILEMGYPWVIVNI